MLLHLLCIFTSIIIISNCFLIRIVFNLFYFIIFIYSFVLFILYILYTVSPVFVLFCFYSISLIIPLLFCILQIGYWSWVIDWWLYLSCWLFPLTFPFSSISFQSCSCFQNGTTCSLRLMKKGKVLSKGLALFPISNGVIRKLLPLLVHTNFFNILICQL